MTEAWRTYLGVALGLGETSRKRVRKVVKDAVGRGNATADQVKTMTGDLLAANTANREAMAKLVKFEVDRALGRVGLATAEEVRELTGRVHELERELRSARATTPAGTAAARKASGRRPTTTASTGRGPASKATGTRARKAKATAAATQAPATEASADAAKKATATKATAKKATAKKATATKASATKATAKKASATKATAKKASATKATAKKATATKAAKKTAAAKQATARPTVTAKAQP
jgi:polyhydroxyalkanoate synthesis regulator phasin